MFAVRYQRRAAYLKGVYNTNGMKGFSLALLCSVFGGWVERLFSDPEVLLCADLKTVEGIKARRTQGVNYLVFLEEDAVGASQA
ncbi:MAG: hypothetical protein N4A70_07365 [Pelagimonas sp.]|jgi:hypothetical protein|nr:hypothetical protein [Pelagimonas sp.]